MKEYFEEFKKFISKGNVLDLAVGVVVGGAFSSIVNSLVNDIIMPLVGVILGGVDFTALAITIKDSSINYGNFIQAIVNFLIIAYSMFVVVRTINNLEKVLKKEEEKKAEEKPAEPSDEVKLLTEIRDSLKKEPAKKTTAKKATTKKVSK